MPIIVATTAAVKTNSLASRNLSAASLIFEARDYLNLLAGSEFYRRAKYAQSQAHEAYQVVDQIVWGC